MKRNGITLCWDIHYSMVKMKNLKLNCFPFFLAYKRYQRKKSALHLHVNSFEQYIKEGYNPMGLRIHIFLNISRVSEDFKKSG